MPRDPLWRSIAATLSAEIAAGSHRPGDKLPTEAQLAARFGVNRHTVRHALAALAEARTVFSRRGAGVFVTTVPTDYPIGRRVRFHQNVLASGRSPSRRILRMETRPCTAVEAEALSLAATAGVHVIEGVSLADGLPMALFLSVFPAAPFPGLPEEVMRLQSITAALAKAGVADYTRASTRLTAMLADTVQALALQIAPGEPLLQSVTVNVDEGGQRIEFGTTWFVGDRVTLTVKPD